MNLAIKVKMNRQQQGQQQILQRLSGEVGAIGTVDTLLGSLTAPTDADKQVAAQATQAFEKGNYGECCSHMNKLIKVRKADCKVVHNMAVAAFYNSQQLGVEDLKNNLNIACQMAKSAEDPLEGIEDVENAVLFFNQAVVQFYLKQYRAALAILEKGFQYIEPPDEALAQNVLLLWTELHLCIGQPVKALDVLSYLEKGVSNGKGGGTPEKGEQGKDGSSGSTDSTDALRVKMFLLKTRALAMMKHTKILRREMKSISNASGASGFAIQCMKAYAEDLKGNPKKGLKFMLLPSKDVKEYKDYVSAEELGKYVGHLGRVPCPGQSLAMMYYNNLACIYHHTRKHSMALQHLLSAYRENDRLLTYQVPLKQSNKENKAVSDKKPLHWTAVSRHFELLYNLGVQLLHCGQPQAAFDCLMQVVHVYHINPRLWLRLAECCIMHRRQNNDEDSKLEKRLMVIQGSVGSGIHRKLVIGPGTGQDKLCSLEPAMPALTMEFASLCLSNALNLLPPDPLDVEMPKTEDLDSSKPSPEPVVVQAPPGNPLRPTEVANLRCSILTASAYLALCLNDYIVALKHCKNLLRQPRLSGAQRYVGNMYMAEALLASDRIADAIGHLNPDSLGPADVNTVPPSEPKNEQEKNEKVDKEEKEQDDKQGPVPLVQWIPNDVRKAKGFMLHNLAVCHAIRSEHAKASTILKDSAACLGNPPPAQTLYLKIYLELIQGNLREFHALVREHFGHMTPNH